MPKNLTKIKCGLNERLTFGKIKEPLGIPYLIEVQKDSYENFLKTGIKEVFDDFSPITDYSNRYELHFLSHTLEGQTKYYEQECRERDATFALPLKVKVRLVNKETGEVIDSEVFIGDFPIMTNNGSFIINGAERVVVSQLVRSPGVYNGKALDKSGKDIYDTTVIPNRGAWLEFEQDSQDVLWVHVDRTRKLTATVLLRALGFGTDSALAELFDNNFIIKNTTDKDTSKTEGEALIELYKRLKPGEVPTEDTVKVHLNNLFFDPRRYDLAKVGRYKINKKLCLATRITGLTAFENITENGEVIVKENEVITEEKAAVIQNLGINEVFVKADKKRHKILGNNTVSFNETTKLNFRDFNLMEYVYYPVLKPILDKKLSETELKAAIRENAAKLCPKHITVDDIVATVSNNISLVNGIGDVDNIDHLGNRRVRSVGELLQNQFRVGIARLERVIKERMATQSATEVTPASLINVRPVTAAIKEFFGSSQLSQFMDQSNPIAELTHKRKLSALGPGGLNRERATFDVRDVHHSHYGRMCPIETPEGQNIGLISSLSTFAKINEYGFIESPYRKVNKKTGVVTDTIHYLTADEEDKYVVAQANEPLDAEGRFLNERVTCRRKENITEVPKTLIDYMDVSPKQLVSIATALIPFLENDDTNRALMGSNMQRQAVPLLKTEAPMVGTGIEAKIAYDSGVMIIAKENGVVKSVTADHIKVKTSSGIDTYNLLKFSRSNQGTCINQRPLVSTGEAVKKGQVIGDGHSTDSGELALGKNVLVGFMAWEGYNYEDAILISEKLVKEDIFTSIHIEEHELEARDTKLGIEEITRDIPNIGDDALSNLNDEGIIRIGAEVRSGDILVGKVTPKGEQELTPEERLLRAIFGEKAREVRDTSLRVPHGEGGVVVDVKIFTRENKDELAPGVNKMIRVYIAQKRKISIGDKMAGRHGNKGVISRILPESDMPFLADGTPLQIVLNPLGVPSRMNIGQVLEVHLGLVCKQLGWKIATPVFDGANEQEIKELLLSNNIVSPEGKVDGKIQLFDGRTGEAFENRVTVGYMYMLKLIHLVDDKIHARSTGPYSLVTQQPLGGKAQFGGQRFGEMEVWALEAYGAAHILQEILTVKSDDVIGRVKTYESIVKGNNVSEPGIPESFKVVIKELQSLGLDMKVLTETKEELGLKELTDEDVGSVDLGDDDFTEISLKFDAEEEEDEEETVSIFDENEEDLEGFEFKRGDLLDEDEDLELNLDLDEDEDNE